MEGFEIVAPKLPTLSDLQRRQRLDDIRYRAAILEYRARQALESADCSCNHCKTCRQRADREAHTYYYRRTPGRPRADTGADELVRTVWGETLTVEQAVHKALSGSDGGSRILSVH